MLTHLEVPPHMHRNHKGALDGGPERTGELLISLAARQMGFESLADVDVLDVGCGVRFTMTFINRAIPIKSYTGVEVESNIVDYLKAHVEGKDSRFTYRLWDVYNDLYNRDGVPLAQAEPLPVDKKFDVIWLFSVFTHLPPEDAAGLLKILRGHIREGGSLFFSAFVDDSIERFEDRIPDQPLLRAFFGRQYLRSLIESSGWSIEGEYERDPENYIQNYFVCRPV